MKVLSFLILCQVATALLLGAAEQIDPRRIVTAARTQIGKTRGYDPAYRVLKYPNGDVPIEAGVCTDVVIRALRASLGMDLQKLVHEDMQSHFSLYPHNWGLHGPDKNIDHRRVPNLQIYFKRSGYNLPVSENPQDYKPGDFVTCMVSRKLPHIMIVSDRTNSVGQPLVIHNIGAGAQEEDRLFEFRITGHYRLTRNRAGGTASGNPTLPTDVNRTGATVTSRR